MIARVKGTASASGSAPGSAPGSASASVLLRCDMDALPLLEETPNISHISRNVGCHHACGHDGHSTMLAGALVKLQQCRDSFDGSVIGIFQPAEETGIGAKQMLDSGLISKPTAGSFGLHNIPGVPLGEILLREHGVAARASCGIRFHIRGKAAHASQPENGVSPSSVLGGLVMPGSPLLLLPQQLLDNGVIPSQINGGRVLATPVHLSVGSDDNFGVLPSIGMLNLTLRADRTEEIDLLREALHNLIRTKSKEAGCECIDVDIVEPFPATMNDRRRTSIVQFAATALKMPITKMTEPFSWSEDFGYFGERFDSGAAFFGIGAGENVPPLHSKHYDFPDELIDRGVNLWRTLSLKALSRKSGTYHHTGKIEK